MGQPALITTRYYLANPAGILRSLLTTIDSIWGPSAISLAPNMGISLVMTTSVPYVMLTFRPRIGQSTLRVADTVHSRRRGVSVLLSPQPMRGALLVWNTAPFART
jgi:hypothetical protein